MDRGALGSWLQGPPSTGAPSRYRGERLGRPESGPGSVAGFGARLAAIAVDWAASILISRAIIPSVPYGSGASSWAVLAIFAVEVALLTMLGGASLGQRLLRLRVVRVEGGALAPLPVVVRTVALSLAIPALVMDRDGRGLHDRAARSVVVRTR